MAEVRDDFVWCDERWDDGHRCCDHRPDHVQHKCCCGDAKATTAQPQELAAEGQRLANNRAALIAVGVDPAMLLTPVSPPAPETAATGEV
jgi:hypothetical protein